MQHIFLCLDNKLQLRCKSDSFFNDICTKAFFFPPLFFSPLHGPITSINWSAVQTVIFKGLKVVQHSLSSVAHGWSPGSQAHKDCSLQFHSTHFLVTVHILIWLWWSLGAVMLSKSKCSSLSPKPWTHKDWTGMNTTSWLADPCLLGLWGFRAQG